jgi:16S rRNA (cytosine967-C5)-methyltransferase
LKIDLRFIFQYNEYVLKSIEKALGGDIINILFSLTKPPNRLYLRVNLLRTSREDVLESIEKDGYKAYEDKDLEEAVYIPVEGPYKLEQRGKIVVADKRASESVMIGSNLYSPGVISCGNVREGDEVSVVSENGILVAVGKAMVGCADAVKTRSGVFVKVEESLYRAAPVRELTAWLQGLIYPQSFPSMIASRMLFPEGGDVIIDMCAAPGGKTGHIYELSMGRAEIYAIDHSARRINEMLENFKRLGYKDKIKVYRLDSRYLSRDLSIKSDKVIIDPPCTDTGVKPKLWHRISYRDLDNLVRYQIQFLGEAQKILKDRGILVYSTCSITYDENEMIIGQLIENKGFEVVEPPYWVKRRAFVTDYGMIRFDPRSGYPGFFIASLRKKKT